MKKATCSSCGAAIVWLETASGKSMPVNAETARADDHFFDDEIHVSHFSSCPHANQHRKTKAPMPKPKNTDLPGIEGAGVAPVRIPEIDQLAEKYVRERDKRCAMTPKEIAAKQALMDAIHTHADQIGRDAGGVIRYHYDDSVVTLAPGKEKLKVTAASEDGEGGEE
jgi:hypothetical protein